MPADSGMAFVLIPHLDPSHKSLMVELLARETAMRVREATQNTLIRPNHVYVIPPNRYLAFSRRRLALSRPPQVRDGQTAIDFAFRSLALDQAENAVGIVLSGTGSHGTAGLKEIKLAGGLALVQDPCTAQHEQMPRSALTAGIAVDYVLAPEDMPHALVAYARYASRQRSGEAESPDAGTLDALRSIVTLLRARTRQDFRHYRKSMILRRIQRRMALQHIETIEKYGERLRRNTPELAALRRDLLISVTTFFREPEAFAVLAAQVLPNLIRRASAEGPVRVWVPACSTGEEAYSIAMLLIEQFRAARKKPSLQIFATDVDEDSIEIARRGAYPDSIAAAVSPAQRQRFFIKSEPHHFQVGKQLREAVLFAPQNLLSDPPFSKIDLISCRNALIYLEPDVQAKVISLLHYALTDRGYLMLGPAESLGPAADLFEPVSRKWRIYRRIAAARRQQLSVPVAASTGRRTAVERFERFEPARRRSTELVELMQRLLLDEFAPAAVLVNRKYHVLSVQGQLVNYVQIPPGEPTQDLLAMARESLRARIRAACEKAMRKGATVRDSNARVRRNGRYVPCVISVRPLSRSAEADGLMLVVFQDGANARSAHTRYRRPVRETSATRQLEEELRVTRADLRRTIAELESSNEDLKASNEEVMSMNEELQSSNEELESSKEEMQSLNEELVTSNSQLEEKVAELDAANSDLTNLVAATGIAIVFLDAKLRIRRFTTPAAQLLALMPDDVGRPFVHFAPRLADADLAKDARRVIATATPVETEVHAGDNRWYLRRILPYRGKRGPLGLVVTLIDVTSRVQTDAESRRFATVLRDSTDAILLVDFDGRITAWNHGAEILYGYTETEALEMSVGDLTAKHDGETLDVMKRIAGGDVVPAFEARRRAKDGRLLDVGVRITLLRDSSGSPVAVAMTERDITAWRRSARETLALNAQLEKRTVELQASEQRMRAILDASADALVAIDTTGKVVDFNRSAALLFGYTAGEVIGQKVGILMPPGERERHDGYLSRYLKTREPHLIGNPRELTACRKDGVHFPVRLSVTEVEGMGLFVGCVRDMTASRALQEEVLSIAMLEQHRIGQELHDGTLQELTGLGLLAQNLSEKLSRQGEASDAELAGRLAGGIAEANLRVRSLARGLVPVPIDVRTLPAALGELAKNTADTYKLACKLECPEPVNVRDASTATHLYRIAQEAVVNAVRHSKADAISIRLAHADGELLLEVRDNGVGIPQQRPAHSGVGMRLMEYRCSVVGGKFVVGGQEGGGTVVACTLPGVRRVTV